VVNLPSLIDEDVYYTKYVVDRSRVVVGDLKMNIMQVHVSKKTIPVQDHRSKNFTYSELEKNIMLTSNHPTHPSKVKWLGPKNGLTCCVMQSLTTHASRKFYLSSFKRFDLNNVRLEFL